MYYIKENVVNNPKYKKISNSNYTIWEIFPENEKNNLELIRDGSGLGRYYDTSKKVVFEIQLREIFVFPDNFLYHPNDIKVAEGEYTFDFQDHEGYDASATDWALRVLLDSMYSNIMNFLNRQVEFSKKEKSGLVNLLPKLSNSFGNFIIR